MSRRDRPVPPSDCEEVLALIEELIRWLRVGTFDEQDGEREVRDRAQALLERYRRAT